MTQPFDFLNKTPGLIIAKDIQSIYLNITQDFASLLGFKSSEECTGKRDYDIPSKAAEFADQFIKMDKQVITENKKMIALDIQEYTSGWKMILVERNPLKNSDGQVIGLFNQCIDVSETAAFRPYLILHQLDNKISGKSLSPVSYTLSQSHSPFLLTEKQEYCLFLLIRGKTVKEIAKVLSISPRTVESHIEALKIKLRCRSKSEIIEKAIMSGFLHYIPGVAQSSLKL
jgi:DNA-binding CsgD family transcriptional regulator